MPNGHLGNRLQTWLRNLPIVGEAVAYQQDIRQRRANARQEVQQRLNAAWRQRDWGQVLVLLAYNTLLVLLDVVPFNLGALEWVNDNTMDAADQFVSDPQAFLLNELVKQTNTPAFRAWVDFAGGVVTRPILTLLEEFANDPSPDPHAFSERFHGIASGLPWAASVMDSSLGAVLGNRAPKMGQLVMSLYWGLGMGFLGWQTLAPLLSSGLQPNLERYYNKLYRPQRFTPSQASDLYALGLRSPQWLGQYLSEQGWPADDIEAWVQLSYRLISEGALWDLYDTGQISKSDMDARLRARGYDPADIPLLYKSHLSDEAGEAQRFLLSTVKRAFRDGRMSESEFRSVMTERGYDPLVIDLLVAELSLAREEDEKELTQGNIRLLYNQRVIGRDEAIHNLQGLDYSPQIASQLVQAWDNQALPKAARINRSTILEGYTDGVLTREQAKDWLVKETGFTPDKAELLLRIEETERPGGRFVAMGPAVSLSLLADFAQAGLITVAEMNDRAELELFTPQDRERIITLMFEQVRLDTDIAELPVSLLEQAYAYGVISRGDFEARLTARGLPPEDIRVLIDTVELEYPEVFGVTPVALMRQPSVGALQVALQRGLIDETGFRDRLTAQGFSTDAADIYLFNAQYSLTAEPRLPTKADLARWYKNGVITRADYVRRMMQLGFLLDDIELYLQAEELALEDTREAALYRRGLLNATGFALLAEEMGYSTDEIAEYLLQFGG